MLSKLIDKINNHKILIDDYKQAAVLYYLTYSGNSSSTYFNWELVEYYLREDKNSLESARISVNNFYVLPEPEYIQEDEWELVKHLSDSPCPGYEASLILKKLVVFDTLEDYDNPTLYSASLIDI